MSKYGSNSEICRFVSDQDMSFDIIYKAVKAYSLVNKQTLDFADNQFRFGYIKLEEINFKYAENVSIIDDTVSFELVVEACFSVKKRIRGDYEDIDDSLWFRLLCEMVVTDKLDSIKIKKIEEYTKSNKKLGLSPATANFVPIIKKDQFDAEAEKFLQKWYPQALDEPMPVPIRHIVQDKMGLVIIDDKKLSKDFKIFGQICFNEGIITTYSEIINSYEEIKVERGTILIDPDTFYLRNLGCANNTLAHEAFHWERHRIYATIKNLSNKEKLIACRCPTSPQSKVIKDAITEEADWMEWQANGIAPKILMPIASVTKKAKDLNKIYGYVSGESNSCEKMKMIIDELAKFFEVSKQAAKIRMIEIGYSEAAKVYNYDTETSYLSSDIIIADALYEYENNIDFKELIDLDLFRYVEGQFVINDKKYIIEDSIGRLSLTDYARNNVSECILLFTCNLVSLVEHNKSHGILLRPSGQYGVTARYEDNAHNVKIINYALEANVLKNEVAKIKAISDTAVQLLCKWMDVRKWNSSIFQRKTFLSSDYYSKLLKHPNKQMKLPQLVSICFGLQLEQSVSLEIIQKAGFNLTSISEEHVAYTRILSPLFKGKTIYDCNDFIEECNKTCETKIHLLGAQDYKSK